MQKKIINCLIYAFSISAMLCAQNLQAQSLTPGYGVFIQQSADNECDDAIISGNGQYNAPGSGSDNDKATAANNLYFTNTPYNYIRFELHSHQWFNSPNTWKSNYLSYPTNSVHPLKVLLTLIWDNGYNNTTPLSSPVPFPDATVSGAGSYQSFVDGVMSYMSGLTQANQPALYVIENEELNTQYHAFDYNTNNGYPDCDKYLAMLSYAVHNTAHNTVNIPVTNGGLTEELIRILCAVALDNAYTHTGGNGTFSHSTVKNFELQMMPPSNYFGYYKTETLPSGITRDQNSVNQYNVINYVMTNTTKSNNNYKNVGLAFVNVHWYEPIFFRGWNDNQDGGTPSQDNLATIPLISSPDQVTPGFNNPYAITDILNNLQSLLSSTQKIISNETGQMTTSPCLTKSITTAISSLQTANKLSTVSFFDGDGAKGDNNSNTVQYDAKAFHNTMSTGVTTLRSCGHNLQSFLSAATQVYGCGAYAITPTTGFCTSGIYSITNLTTGATVAWSISPSSGVANLYQSNNQATLTRVADGTITLTATITLPNGACSPAPLQLTSLPVGNPYPTGTSYYDGQTFPFQGGGSTIVGPGASASFSYTITDSRFSNFSWTLVPPNPAGSYFSGSGNFLSMSVTAPTTQGSNTEIVKMNATGPCGVFTTNVSSTAAYVSGYGFSVSPNPGHGSANITVTNSTTGTAKQLIYAIRITDQKGNMRRSLEYKDGVQNINVSYAGMTPGNYLISVFNGFVWTSKTIIIQ